MHTLIGSGSDSIVIIDTIIITTKIIVVRPSVRPLRKVSGNDLTSRFKRL